MFIPRIKDQAMTSESSEGLSAGGDVRAIVRRFLLRSNIPEVGDDEDLFESGIVNSLFAVQLTTFIEKTFRIEITSDDLDIANFKSLNAATDFVLRRRAAVHS
jgi:methoxymalonate biosynthesis acyl carrier protein